MRRIVALPCGRWSKWAVLVLWLVVIAGAVPLAGKLSGAQKNDTANWLPGSAESTKVLDLQKKFEDTEAIPGLIVYERTSGITAADSAKVASDIEAYHGLDRVEAQGFAGPIPAKDGKALEVLVPLRGGSDGWNKIPDIVDKMHHIADSDANGLSMHVTGPAGFAADSADAFKGIDGQLLYAAAGVVILVLLLTYRSPVLWLLPVLTAGCALFGAQALIYLLAKHAGLVVNGQSAGILTVLVFGAGTDYALLLIARYREELRRHENRHEAMAIALRRAGPAIIASAATVAVGMLCLLVADMNSTRGLGPVAAIGVGVALLAMMTLLPALLVVCGRWVFWPKRPTLGSAEPTEKGWWARTGHRISRRPRTVWAVTAVVLGALAIGVVDLNAVGLANKDSFVTKPASITGEQILAKHFAAGQGQPLVVIGDASAQGKIIDAVEHTDGIAPPAKVTGVRDGLVDVEATTSDAPDSKAAQRTVDRLRDAVHAVPGADARVGGGTAIAVDIARASTHDRNVIIPLVLVVVFLILALLLRALLAPLILVATVVLSFAAALGASALVFRHVFGFAGADTSFPLFVFVFLVALGIDYNIFLMTRVREETQRFGTRRGALIGLGATGGVITSAGLVLAGTFAVLATLPLVAFAEIGFAVALGVLLDTLVVRSVLVTALNLDVGRRIWWPHGLSRRDDVSPTDAHAEPESAALVT